MKVAVTGGTGFTGRRVVRRLVEEGHDVRCLVRPSSDRSALAGLELEFVEGALEDPASLVECFSGADALLNVASLGFGHAPGIIKACSRAGVERAVFFSTTAIFTTLPAPSRWVRVAAEQAIHASGLAFTILRPTMIYGAPGDRNAERLLRAAARWPVLPVVGRGERKLQPVMVDDLADAAVAALANDDAVGRCYQLAGQAPVSFRDLVIAAFRAVGRRARVLPVPAEAALLAARLCERLLPRARIRAEQVRRLMEDKDFSWAAAGRDFGFEPVGVEEGLMIEAERLGLSEKP